MKLLRGCVFLLAGATLVACSSAQSDWQRASVSNTVAAYQTFLDKHPNTPQSVRARNRIRDLEDQQAWAQAQQANTVLAYQDYIQRIPPGSHVAEAKDHISASERSVAWIAASSADTTEALQAFLQKYPQGPEADEAKAKLAQLTGYRVQLASLRSEKQAERARDRLQGKYGDVLGSVEIVPGTTPDRHLVLSAQMGQGEANTACAKLKKAHQTCEVIKDANS
jgi:cell division septation protein DedD